MMKISASFPPWDGRLCLRRLRIRRCGPGQFWSAAAARPDPTNSSAAGPLLFSVAGLVSKVLWQRIYIIKLCMFNSYFSQLFGLRLAKINYYQISAQSLTSGGGMSLDFGYR